MGTAWDRGLSSAGGYQGLAKLRSPSACGHSCLGLFATGGPWPMQTLGGVTAASSLPKDCILLILPSFLAFSHIWQHHHLSPFSPPLARAADACASGRGKCQGHDLACKARKLHTTSAIYTHPASESLQTVSGSPGDQSKGVSLGARGRVLLAG